MAIEVAVKLFCLKDNCAKCEIGEQRSIFGWIRQIILHGIIPSHLPAYYQSNSRTDWMVQPLSAADLPQRKNGNLPRVNILPSHS